MPLLTLNAMNLVEHYLSIKSVSPLVATSDNSVCVALKVGVYTHVIVDSWVALDIDFLSYLNFESYNN